MIGDQVMTQGREVFVSSIMIELPELELQILEVPDLVIPAEE